MRGVNCEQRAKGLTRRKAMLGDTQMELGSIWASPSVALRLSQRNINLPALSYVIL